MNKSSFGITHTNYEMETRGDELPLSGNLLQSLRPHRHSIRATHTLDMGHNLPLNITELIQLLTLDQEVRATNQFDVDMSLNLAIEGEIIQAASTKRILQQATSP
jgi:hypothetical protein